jgi:hypothetical protein
LLQEVNTQHHLLRIPEHRDRRFRDRDRSFRSPLEIGHIGPERPVTFDRNPRSRSAGMAGHDAGTVLYGSVLVLRKLINPGG